MQYRHGHGLWRGPCGAHCGKAKMGGNHVWRNRRLEAEPVLPTGLLDKPITCVERGTSTSRERASERQDRQVLGRQTDRFRGQARDSILSERRQGKSRQADEDQVRRFHAGAGCLITCLV
jgi:hypothetical protein